jgi:primosomal protein N' (replication factor Y)
VDISVQELDKSFQYSVPKELNDELKIGDRVIIPFGQITRKGYVIGFSHEPQIDVSRIKPIIDIVDRNISTDSRFIKLADWMKKQYGSTMNQALKTVIPIKKSVKRHVSKTVHLLISEAEANSFTGKGPSTRVIHALAQKNDVELKTLCSQCNASTDTIKRLENKGLLEIYSLESFRNEIGSIKFEDKKVELNEEQHNIVNSIIDEYSRKDYTTCLIKGVTGSGKTEVYMEIIDHVIKEGRDAIVLIPEIALTYQTVMRFYNRFGDMVSIIHSRLSDGEKFDRFELARQGKIRIMIGPRTALFTPFANLGLIIIDEEHENAYKSDITPKYHATDVAKELAGMCEAKVILGSATPSMESYYCAKNGIYNLYTLDNRAGKGRLPKVHVVDLRDELRMGNRSVLSNKLYTLIEDRLLKKEQIMLFLNRRGYQGFINCRSCGKVIECPHCAVSLTVHNNNRLVCHYCGYDTMALKLCPHCGSKHIGAFKAGTQMIEETVKKLFPEARTLRMDMDTTKGKHGHENILKEFMEGKADILIGTQMIVKGHDFPNVTLVGVILADTSLHSPDFTAGENTFDLIVQASGRAGRGNKSGEVVIQTYDPSHYAITYAAANDYESFYEEEISFRELMNYPPVTRMLCVTVASAKEDIAINASHDIKTLTDNGETVIIGPADAAIYKLKDQYYRKIYYKSNDYRKFTQIIDIIDRAVKEDSFSGCLIQYDIR